MLDDEPTLPGFTRLVDTDMVYAGLHKLLWPTEPASSQPADPAAPEAESLARCIERCPADLGIWAAPVEDVDMDKSAQCAPAPMVRYINLAEHKDLAVHWLDQCETFIILQEYVEFMADAATATNPRFFLTGQPGIGK